MHITELPTYNAFYTKLRSCNPLETEYTDHVNFSESGLTKEQAVIKLKLSTEPSTGSKNHRCLQQVGKQQQMVSCKDFCAAVTIKLLCQLSKQCKK